MNSKKIISLKDEGKFMRNNKKIFWTSIFIITIVDIMSYFFSKVQRPNPQIHIPLFIILLFAVFLFLFSIRKYISKNIKGSIIGLVLGVLAGIISLGTGALLFFFFIPLYALVMNVVGCGGESCWLTWILVSSIVLGISGMVIGAKMQNE